ncbi:hypothetical protein MKZ38_009985 [Zalerion maritima]|uniref:Uncharacterized protein n=1 Tax=Zalerion maritima TaxID=339359 RepID=A0AAD5RSY8_9PEZI|nr:hypothetical protein MKZ38_009985 [Zalerion maritima]
MKSHPHACLAGLLALGISPVNAQTTTAAAEVPTVISECHLHDSTQYCMVGTTEYEVHLPTTVTVTAVPAEYTGCHSHDDEMFCVDADGEDVEIHLAGAEEEGEEDHEDEETTDEESSSEGEDCHFHAGVEHCTSDSETESSATCERQDRDDYDRDIRIGFLFIILGTSALGVFAPIFIHRALPNRFQVAFTVLKQFGTGVVISTAFIHLYTHATLMFENECLAGYIDYESTAAAILMAGLFISFLVEYLGQRFVRHKANKAAAAAGANTTASVFNQTLHQKIEMINIMVLEAGIIFHSLLIGLTLVVAGDSVFKTLFIVILFHQMFEGIALGSRIAALGTTLPAGALPLHSHKQHGHHGHVNMPAPPAPTMSTGGEEVKVSSNASNENVANPPAEPVSSSSASEFEAPRHLSSPPASVDLRKKLLLALAFALITPLGMAIGIGVLNQFNGNDPTTLIAIGTLDALSAGILVWVGVVEMWAEDWMMGGELTDAGFWKTSFAFVGLVSGMVLMSVLGKWA